jgi:DNA-binding MarR family transcriptional regulator
MPSKTAPAELNLVDALVQLSFRVQALLAHTAGAHHLSLVQLRLLGVLRDREPGVLELARYLGLDKSSVTGLVDRAERRGLVQRRPAPHDGRAICVSVTARGRQLTAEVAAEVEREIQALAAGLSAADQKRLIAIALRLLAVPDGKQ